jgi:hypothetical protein
MEQFKRAKVIMLPTNVLSNISLSNKTNNLVYNKDKHDTLSMFTNQHLYIISDDKPKIGDYYLVELYDNQIQSKGWYLKQCESIDDVWVNNKGIEATRHINNCKKVIATTNTSLTPLFCKTDSKNIPQLSKQFIKKYIECYNKDEIITDVLVEYEAKRIYNNPDIRKADFNYQDILKVNPKDNTITIKKVKDSWNREEVVSIINKIVTGRKCKQEFMCYSPIILDINKWIEENL